MTLESTNWSYYREINISDTHDSSASYNLNLWVYKDDSSVESESTGILDLDNRFDNLFERPLFNFEDIKLEGKPYKITRKEQKVYGIKSNMGEFTQINEGKRNPKQLLNIQ